MFVNCYTKFIKMILNINNGNINFNKSSLKVKNIGEIEIVNSTLILENDELIFNWINGRKIEQHMSLIVVYSGLLHGHTFSSELIGKMMQINIPVGDSILTRIKSKISSLEA